MSNFYEKLSIEAESSFPAHGWILNKGMRHLRMPIMRLYGFEEPYQTIYGADQNTRTAWLLSRSPRRTLRNIAVCLRQLHTQIRVSLEIQNENWFHKEPSIERDMRLTEQKEMTEQSEVLLISVFTLLRRLGDELIDASRPILFEDWKSAPRKMKKMIALANKGDFSQLKFSHTCDQAQFEDAIINNTDWFRKLREINGVRDILIHKPHILQIGGQGSTPDGESETKWMTTAELTETDEKGDMLASTDLLPFLVECLDDLCAFLTKFCLSVNLEEGYKNSDALLLTGEDHDIVGFWPPINGNRTEFPLPEKDA